MDCALFKSLQTVTLNNKATFTAASLSYYDCAILNYLEPFKSMLVFSKNIHAQVPLGGSTITIISSQHNIRAS